jgi:integrase
MALFLKEQQLGKLQTLSRKPGAPIAELVRRAIDAYLLSRKNGPVDRGVSGWPGEGGLSVRSRNLRLTALHSFFRYAAFEVPDHAAKIQRVLAIPSKRFTRALVQFLTRTEVDALLAASDQGTWFGRRDHAFLLVAVQTGLRVS